MPLPDIDLEQPRPSPTREGPPTGATPSEEGPPAPHQRGATDEGPPTRDGGHQEGATTPEGPPEGGHHPGGATTPEGGHQPGATRPDNEVVAPERSGLPDVALSGRMHPAKKAAVTVAFLARQAYGNIRDFVAVPGGFYRYRPESLAQYDERIAEPEWLPEGCEIPFLEKLVDAHHKTLGKFGVVTGYVWAWFWSHPLVFYPTLISVLTVFIIVVF